MSKKVYAIKEGFDSDNNVKIQNKIVSSWGECLKYVRGVKGAKYKSFESMEEAEGYLAKANAMLRKGIDEYPQEALHVYVDGSYNEFTKRYSYALIAIKNNIVEYIDSGDIAEDPNCAIRQIAGELKAAELGVRYAIKKNEKQVVIIHDYEGIAHHATGTWDRKEESSKIYYECMQKLMKEINVIFVKVDSHTGDVFNELADEKCKEKVGIESEKVVDKYLDNNVIYVSSEEVKNEIISITNNKEDKIIIKSAIADDNKIEEVDILRQINKLLEDMSTHDQQECLEFIKKLKSKK